MNASNVRIHETPSRSMAGVIHEVLRFVQALRRRAHLVFAALVVAGILGFVYYRTAPRIFEGKTTLLVKQTGPDVWNAEISPEVGQHNNLVPTCEKLITSAIVLEDAVQRIGKLPPDLRRDFLSRPRGEWTDLLLENVSTRNLRRTNLIDVSFRSIDPATARAVVDALSSSYIAFMDKTHRDLSTEIVATLDKERKQIEDQLQGKQEQLLNAQQQVRVLGIQEGTRVVHPSVQRVARLNELLVEAQKKRVELQATLAAVEATVKQGHSHLWNHLVAIQPLIGRQVMLHALGMSENNLQDVHSAEQKMIEYRSQLETLRSHYGERHPSIVRLKESIKNTESYLTQRRQEEDRKMAALPKEKLGPLLLSMVQERLGESQAFESKMREEYNVAEAEAVGLNNKLVELQILEDDLERLRGFHKSLLDKLTSIDVNQHRGNLQLLIVSEAHAADKPVSPRLTFVAFVCVLLGLVSGCGLVYVMDLLDDRFRSPEEIQEQLGVPVLAMVRRLSQTEETGPTAVQVYNEPQAVESEAFRTLRTTLAFAGYRRIALSSAEPGDGKTTVLSNLGVALVQAGKRTLLIDGDLRRPGLSQLFEMRGREGLAQLIRSELPIAEVHKQYIHSSGIENLDVIPCGQRLTDPSELLSNSRLEELIALAEGVYDHVLIDCPPALAASDAAVLGRQSDALILILQPEKNHRRGLLRSIDELVRLQVHVAGVVVNCADAQSESYYGYGTGYGYGYGGTEEQEATEETILVTLADVVDLPPEGWTERRDVA